MSPALSSPRSVRSRRKSSVAKPRNEDDVDDDDVEGDGDDGDFGDDFDDFEEGDEEAEFDDFDDDFQEPETPAAPPSSAPIVQSLSFVCPHLSPETLAKLITDPSTTANTRFRRARPRRHSQDHRTLS